MSARLANKVCLITGAASGIGAASARRFVAEGAKVVLADLDLAAAEQLASTLCNDGAQTMAAGLDVTEREQVQDLVTRVVDWAGALHVLVNSAGISRRSVAADADFEEAWDRVMKVNLKGTLLMSHAAVAAMRRCGGGSIVNLASIMGSVVYGAGSGMSDGFNPYPHSKGGVIQMTRDLGVQLAAEGIRVNAVCPGFVRTNLTAAVSENNTLHEKICERAPLGRFAEPEEIANVILFLASDEASFVTAAAWAVDGGYTAC